MKVSNGQTQKGIFIFFDSFRPQMEHFSSDIVQSSLGQSHILQNIGPFYFCAIENLSILKKKHWTDSMVSAGYCPFDTFNL